MTSIDRPANAGQERIDPSAQSVEDDEPISVPAVLSPEHQEKARAALAAYAKDKYAHEVAQSLGYAQLYVRAVLDGQTSVTVHFAGQIARVLGTDVLTLTGIRSDSRG